MISKRGFFVYSVVLILILSIVGCVAHKRYDVSLPGVRDLVNNHGNYNRILTEDDFYLSTEECNKLYVDHYGAGNSIFSAYLESITKESKFLAGDLCGDYGGVGLKAGVSEADLARDIKNAIAGFDASHGGITAHDPLDYFDSKEIRMEWYAYLKDKLESANEESRHNYNLDEEDFLDNFEREYGNLPRPVVSSGTNKISSHITKSLKQILSCDSQLEDFDKHIKNGETIGNIIMENGNNPITEEMTKRFGERWEEGRIFSPTEHAMIAGFWASYSSDKLGLGLPVTTTWNDWDKQVSMADLASVTLGVWVWESCEGRTNGDVSLAESNEYCMYTQNNALDVYTYHIWFMNEKYGFCFEDIKKFLSEDYGFYGEDIKRVGVCEGLGIGVSWISVLLNQVKGSLIIPDSELILRDLAIALYMYNPSCIEGTGFEECREGQFWRDNFTMAYGGRDGLWYFYGLDEKAKNIRQEKGWNHQNVSLKSTERYNTDLIKKPLDE